ncbi:hypothetical protein D3C80_944100 [compost metagenome]
MDSPIGHQATSVVPIPPKIEMKTIGIERPFWSWSQPLVIMNTRRNGGICQHRNTLHPTLISPSFDQTDFTQFSTMYKCHCISEMLLTTLPLPHLYNTIIFFRSGNHDFTFPNGVSNRFFNIYVLACCNSIYHLQAMPMVGCGYDNNIHISCFKQIFIINIGFDCNISFF